MSEHLVQYEWAFLSPRSTFDFLLSLEEPVPAKSVIYVVEGLNDDGSTVQDVSFDWLYSRVLERSFLYAEESGVGVTALRQLHAETPVTGIRLIVKQWSDDVAEDVYDAHAACWLYGGPEPGGHEISVLARGTRTEVAA